MKPWDGKGRRLSSAMLKAHVLAKVSGTKSIIPARAADWIVSSSSAQENSKNLLSDAGPRGQIYM